MSFRVGSLVKARGREWVVLPGSEQDMLVLRPLGGTAAEETGIYLPLEPVSSAQFEMPDPSALGDYRSCRLLRDAVRLSSRSGAGPFRSFARIAVEPRSYQLVPLLMALKLNPVRLLIADDVGIGKTVEACLIARELLDRGEISRMAVLCPPHLAEQWQAELSAKFHIEAELVLPSTAGRLERNCRPGQSLLEVYPHVVISMDFIKMERRRGEFIRNAPELLIVDEAHTCAFGYEGRGGRHQRHQLLKELASDESRHLILVTATPHSGKEAAFRSLLSLLRPEFSELPENLAGSEHQADRKRLAAHLVQRRRADIRHFLKEETPFPDREEKEETYRLSDEYRRVFDRVLRYARETVADSTGGHQRQRVRWWAALALLRSLASSPAAAAATLRVRADLSGAETEEEIDDRGRRTVLDADTDDLTEGVDVSPSSDPGGEDEPDQSRRRLLLEMARQAEDLEGEKDIKLLSAVEHLKGFLRDGYRPIVFCRFIPTAGYLARELRKRLPAGVEVEDVTGLLPPADREAKVLKLSKAPHRVLVCTDCLSEGINLQEHFDAVIHYDLSWSPTRHEQRAGRVDRYGQSRSTVRVLTYYGIDNQIDGIVLDVLIRKHRSIRNSTGVAIPIPGDTNAVVEAILEGLLLRQRRGEEQQLLLSGFEEFFRPRKEQLYSQWESAADKEKRSRSVFAQESIKPEEVFRELAEARSAVGSAVDVAAFTVEALRAFGAVISERGGQFHFDLRETPRALRDLLSCEDTFRVRFELPVAEGTYYLSRTHPLIEALASYVLESALDPVAEGVAKRSGSIRTRAVTKRTTLLLVRFRYDLVTRRGGTEQSQLAEETRLLAFEGAPENAVWLEDEAAEAILGAEPDANVSPDQAADFVRRVVDGIGSLRPHIEQRAQHWAAALLAAHQRVRQAAGLRHLTYRIIPQLPADILGVYVYLPATSVTGVLPGSTG